MHELPGVSELSLRDTPIPFGKEMLKQFYFDKEWRNMNHGSFGTYPRSVGAVLQALHEEAEAKPDIYIRITHVERLNHSRHLLARFLDVPPSTVVLVPNATTGINTVFNNLRFNPGDTILCFSTTYSSCVNTLLWIAEATPAKVESIPLLTPAALSNEAILASVEAMVEKHRKAGLNPRVLLLDTIVSQPAFRMPYEALVALCKRLGVFSVIDAAHSIGHTPLDITGFDPDFLVTNAHKWLFVPRACAVMYVPLRNQHLIRTSMPTSANFLPRAQPIKVHNPLGASSNEDNPDDTSPFVKLFEYVGTLDSTPYLCVEAAMEFREKMCGGEEAVQAYVSSLAQNGGDLVAKMLGTEVLDNKEGTLRKGLALVNVRLPLDADDIGALGKKVSPEAEARAEADAAAGAGATSAAGLREENPVEQPEHAAAVSYWIEKTFMEEFNTFVAVRWWGGAWWTRLSGQVYLDLEDFKWVGTTLMGLCERVKKGEHLKSG